ncbi:uncharacterized protein LOC101204218 isoform X1 [Cucumis sativus]|uniref:uncharacterized protein LOC101204218 isoform X1 n=1 Tax=Cucumis sativus TaxID=3659 RepID=UPI0002B44F8D|nr:uncharacterized protein LOC101204218 isoform X1 [Cucumis sativus]
MVARMTTSRPSLGRPIIFASSRLCSFFRSRRFLCRETTAEAMFTALEIPPPCPAAKLNVVRALPSQFRFYRLPYNLGLPNRQLPSLSIRAQSLSDPSTSSRYTDTIGTSSPAFLQFPQCTLTQRHILVLNVVACATAISATWLFCSAIPTLLAFKRAAESLEKLMDVTREEIPGTMAAIRLSGMEISDLTMELSDLGQGITQGVRSSTRAVRVAEERLRRLTNMSPTASVQEMTITNLGVRGAEPVLAKRAKDIKEGILKGRSIFQLFLSLTRFSGLALNYFSKRGKK